MKNNKNKKPQPAKENIGQGTQKKPLFRVLSMFGYAKWRILMLLALGVLGVAMFSFTPTITGNIFDSLEETILAGASPEFMAIYRYLAIFGALVLFNEIFQVIAIFTILRYENDMKEKMMSDVKAKLDVVPISFLDNYGAGDLGRRISSLAGSIVRHVLSVIYRGSRTMFFFITTSIAMFSISWILALVVISSLPIAVITAKIVSSKTQKFFNTNNSVLLETFGYVDQKFAMHEFYQLHGLEGAEAEYETLNVKEQKSTTAEEISTSLNTIYIAFIQNMMFLIVAVVFGILFVNNLIFFGALPAFLVFSNRFLANAVIVTEVTNVLQLVGARAPKVFEILDAPIDVTEHEHISVDKVGDISFRDVTLVKDDEVKLHKISLNIPRGSSVAFVGPTGSGKSRVLEIIAKLELPTEGEVSVAGTNLNEINKDEYYQKMGIAFEKPFIFKGSVAENLLYGVRRAMPERVMNVTKRLGMHNFIEQLPESYETMLTDKTNLLSNSQKQALNIARTVLNASDLVMFSDAQSFADPVTEKEIYEKIMTMNPNQTKIFATHRLATVEKCDIIVFMEKGRVVEMGNHSELMRKKKRYYNAFVSN